MNPACWHDLVLEDGVHSFGIWNDSYSPSWQVWDIVADHLHLFILARFPGGDGLFQQDSANHA